MDANAVIWCTIASGRDETTASITAFLLSPSSTIVSAPNARRASVLPAVRVVATTWCPFEMSSGTSCLPTAPVAPATKIFIFSLPSFRNLLDPTFDIRREIDQSNMPAAHTCQVLNTGSIHQPDALQIDRGRPERLPRVL